MAAADSNRDLWQSPMIGRSDAQAPLNCGNVRQFG